MNLPMTFRLRPARCLAAAIFLLGPALSSTASGQEAMQLDLEFKNSLLRGQTSQDQTEERYRQQQPIAVAGAIPGDTGTEIVTAIEELLRSRPDSSLRPRRRKMTPGSAASADRRDHFVNLRIFAVYGWVGAQ